ncbi:hypothetical protein KUV74_12615 [Halomonas sp. DP1Y21-3]|uniref:hypothetical protein n=1 Tax=Halomonas sp. DP1Y21-3 TaxID=2859080 RepID=UPI001C93E51C|nr:hypothetical protein [Halomonas sp. DP1Y21-3]MBY6111237.1 hypothetical protein [Halomonas sp. DP1Y21-3]
MRIDSTVDRYRETKQSMESIIDRHIQAAFNEIREELGTVPTYVSLNVSESQTIEEKYPQGVYTGCSVSLAGE